MTDDDREDEGGHTPTTDPSKAFRENPPADDEVKEIEEERERRLDPDNRPDGAEVDNTGDRMPEIARSDPDESAEGQAGHADPGEVFRENPPDEDEIREIEAERERRLDPDNRPDDAEVDNTGENVPDIVQGFTRRTRSADLTPAVEARDPPAGAGASVRPMTTTERPVA